MVSSLFAGIPSLLVVIEEGWLPESLTRRTRPWGTYAPPMGGRHQIGMVAGFNSEWWPASNRNPGRHHVGIPGRNASESAVNEHVGVVYRSGAAKVFLSELSELRNLVLGQWPA